MHQNSGIATSRAEVIFATSVALLMKLENVRRRIEVSTSTREENAAGARYVAVRAIQPGRISRRKVVRAKKTWKKKNREKESREEMRRRVLEALNAKARFQMLRSFFSPRRSYFFEIYFLFLFIIVIVISDYQYH